MATAEHARTLNDATLRHGLDNANRRLYDAQQELAAAQEQHDVLLAEYRRRMIDDPEPVATSP